MDLRFFLPDLRKLLLYKLHLILQNVDGALDLLLVQLHLIDRAMQRVQTVRDVVILQIRTDLRDWLIDLPKIADHRERMDLIVRVSAVAVLVHADRHQQTLFVVEPDGLTADTENRSKLRNGKRSRVRILYTVRYVHKLPHFFVRFAG